MTTLTVPHAVRRVANRENVSNDSTSVMLLSFKVKRASGIDLEEYSLFIFYRKDCCSMILLYRNVS